MAINRKNNVFSINSGINAGLTRHRFADTAKTILKNIQDKLNAMPQDLTLENPFIEKKIIEEGEILIPVKLSGDPHQLRLSLIFPKNNINDDYYDEIFNIINLLPKQPQGQGLEHRIITETRESNRSIIIELTEPPGIKHNSVSDNRLAIKGLSDPPDKEDVLQNLKEISRLAFYQKPISKLLLEPLNRNLNIVGSEIKKQYMGPYFLTLKVLNEEDLDLIKEHFTNAEDKEITRISRALDFINKVNAQFSQNPDVRETPNFAIINIEPQQTKSTEATKTKPSLSFEIAPEPKEGLYYVIKIKTDNDGNDTNFKATRNDDSLFGLNLDQLDQMFSMGNQDFCSSTYYHKIQIPGESDQEGSRLCIDFLFWEGNDCLDSKAKVCTILNLIKQELKAKNISPSLPTVIDFTTSEEDKNFRIKTTALTAENDNPEGFLVDLTEVDNFWNHKADLENFNVVVDD